jgi:hypothetical protein
MVAERGCFCDPGPNIMGLEALVRGGVARQEVDFSLES